jgi:outer membrane protein OmpA-like peptidoglycan-associated protein
MHNRKLLAAGLAAVVSLSGCATMHEREWNGCALGGAVLGGLGGGLAAGLLVNNVGGHADKGEQGGAIAGGVVGGAALGTVLGHMICDPKPEPPAPPPVAAPAPPPPTPGTKIATVGSTYFDFDKAVIKSAGDKDVLADAIKVMRDNPTLNVSVEGHADSVGSDAYNQTLSEKRAVAVKNYLVGAGIDGARISTVGYGESKPIASNDTAEGRAQNRRAEIIAR